MKTAIAVLVTVMTILFVTNLVLSLEVFKLQGKVYELKIKQKYLSLRLDAIEYPQVLGRSKK